MILVPSQIEFLLISAPWKHIVRHPGPKGLCRDMETNSTAGQLLRTNRRQIDEVGFTRSRQIDANATLSGGSQGLMTCGWQADHKADSVRAALPSARNR